jgi:energy-coupling factor transporter ATP-binding protein EcfA2
MYARLGFSIAAHVEPKVLLVDEVLAVGDAAFRLRCLERMKELVRGGTGLVFVTHNLEQVQPICRRTVVLDGGRVRFVGPSSEAVSHYLAALSQGRTSRPTDLPADAAAIGSTVTLAGVRIGPAAGAATGRSHGTRGPAMELRLRCHRPPVPVIIECNLRGIGYENLLSLNSGRDGRPLSLDHEDNIVALKLADIPLAPGQYFWNVRVWDAKNGQTLLDTPFRFPFVLAGGPVTGGLVQVEHSWSCAASELRRADMEPAALSESIRDGSPLACTDYVYQPGR